MFRTIFLISAILTLGACSTVGSSSKSHKHTQTVYFAVNNLNDGDAMTWHDNSSSTHGSVKILATQSFGGKTCRVVNNHIQNPYRVRNFTQYACTLDQGLTWQFHTQ